MENNVQSSGCNRTPIILSVLALVMAAVVLVFQFIGDKNPKVTIPEGDSEVMAQRGDIVYIRMDTLIMQYDMASDLSSTFQAEAQAVQDDLNKRGRKLESDMKSFENQYQKGLLTRSNAEQQQNALLKRQQELQNLANQKQLELQEKEFVMNNQIIYAIKTYLEEYNKVRGYAAILTTTDMNNTIIVGNVALDITQEVVEGLNAEYIKVRNKN
ncbi:MAG: OmpH family outer membrane protein [Bacteroidales bacterium]|nr:OmpH family outer membrane protein [Bacteroidales bacterium]